MHADFARWGSPGDPRAPGDRAASEHRGRRGGGPHHASRSRASEHADIAGDRWSAGIDDPLDTPTLPGAPRPTTPMPVAALFQPTSAAFTVSDVPVILPEAEFGGVRRWTSSLSPLTGS